MVFRCEAPGQTRETKRNKHFHEGGPKKKAQGFSRQVNIEGTKQNERGLEVKASSGNKTLIIQEKTHTRLHTHRERYRHRQQVPK